MEQYDPTIADLQQDPIGHEISIAKGVFRDRRKHDSEDDEKSRRKLHIP